MNGQVKKYVKMIFSRIWVILVLAIAGAGITYFFNDAIYKEMYEAKVRLILVADESNVQNISVFDMMRSSQMAVGDICQIITSEAVLSDVEMECGVNQTYIGKILKINAIPNTRILDISVQIDSPELALKLVQSLDKNLREKLMEVDNNVTYKVLSRPYVDLTPVNKHYPVLFTVGAAIGGFILGGLINLVIGEMNMLIGNLNYICGIFEEKNILPVPTLKLVKHEGGAI